MEEGPDQTAAERVRERVFAVHRWGNAGAAAGMLACAALAYGHAAGAHGLSLLAGVLGAWIGARAGRMAHDLREQSRLESRCAAAVWTTAREAGEGWVALVGVVRAIETVEAPSSGVPCVAWVQRTTEGETGAVTFRERSGGGRFALEDGSGAWAEVDAASAVFAGVELGDADEVVLRDGARVAVIGRAVRVGDASELGPVPHRSMATRLVLAGTEDEPLILRPVGFSVPRGPRASAPRG